MPRKRQRSSKEEREALKNFRAWMLDSASMRVGIQTFIEKAIEERRAEGDSDSVIQITERWLQSSCGAAASVIERRARSPIERLFFNAFLLGLIKNDAMNFQFHDTFENAPEALEKYSNYYEEIRQSFELYQRETGDIEGKDFPRVVDKFVESGELSREHGNELVTGVTFVYRMNMWNAMHFTLQPRFPGFGLRGRALTTDMLVWIPGKPSVRVVVECDGFTYHSDREAFVADRRRDRVFQQRGYRVLRFSGTEIHADPIGMSFELSEAIDAIAGPKQYHPLSYGYTEGGESKS